MQDPVDLDLVLLGFDLLHRLDDVAAPFDGRHVRGGRRPTAQAERAAEKAQRDFEKAQRKSARGASFGWSWGDDRAGTGRSRMGFHPPTPPTPPGAPRPPTPPNPVNEPVSDNERLMILRMVETKQITVDEAERLLSALEGRT